MGYRYTKLFEQILESTVWCEPDSTRVVWITMLAMSGRDGEVLSSVPGLAKRAMVTVEQTREALNCFMSPDPDSRTKDFKGRRIAEIDGGWQILNHKKYRDLLDSEAEKERKRLWWEEHRGKNSKLDDTSGDSTKLVELAQASTTTPPATSTTSEKDPMSGWPPDASPLNGNQFTPQAREVLKFLNEKTGRAYKPVKANLGLIAARLKEGATVTECRQVIAKKSREWASDERMAEYLRPATLFNATKFAQYVGELVHE